MTKMRKCEVLIIGGGPAGISAAIWCRELGLASVLLERGEQLGGQLLWTHNPVSNYPGIRAPNGRAVRDLFVSGLDNSMVRLGAEVSSIDVGLRRVELADGEAIAADAIILAMGVRRRKLDVPGEDEFEGRGILASGAAERDVVKGATVVIAGGGDAALENAVILAERAKRVIVVHRGERFRAREEFVTAAANARNVEFRMQSFVKRFVGDRRLSGVEVVAAAGADVEVIGASFALVRIGVVPNTEMLREQIAMDDAGHITTDVRCRTSCRSILAAGDVTAADSATIGTAVGMGATAARTAYNSLKNGDKV
jgi:thioredoxin reductase (NADPH)